MLRSPRLFVPLSLTLVLSSILPEARTPGLPYSLVDVAAKAGLRSRNYFGGETSKKYILETTGSGAAFLDYDGDGWPDIFLVNGSRLEGFPPGQEPTNTKIKKKKKKKLI